MKEFIFISLSDLIWVFFWHFDGHLHDMGGRTLQTPPQKYGLICQEHHKAVCHCCNIIKDGALYPWQCLWVEKTQAVSKITDDKRLKFCVWSVMKTISKLSKKMKVLCKQYAFRPVFLSGIEMKLCLDTKTTWKCHGKQKYSKTVLRYKDDCFLMYWLKNNKIQFHVF